jgi:hypothetical protein
MLLARARRATVVLIALLAMLGLGDCSLGTQAWERDLHADPEMALDHDAVDQGLDGAHLLQQGSLQRRPGLRRRRLRLQLSPSAAP